MKSLLVVAFAVFSFGTPKAQADAAPGWLIQPSLIYYFTTEGEIPQIKQTRLQLESSEIFYWGYSFGTIFLGANYNYDAIAKSGNTTSTDSFSSIGGDLGLITDNIFLFFTYYFSSTAATGVGTANNGEVDFNKGTGFQVKLGYMFDVGSGWSLGPAMTYKSLTYAAFANGTNSGQSTSFTYTTVVPEATIRYRF